MTQQYDNSNTGSLFKNDKGDNEKRPDYKGSINFVCPHCNQASDNWLSAWIRTAGEMSKRAGEKFMSLKAEAKEQQPAPVKKAAPAQVADLTDDIPF